MRRKLQFETEKNQIEPIRYGSVQIIISKKTMISFNYKPNWIKLFSYEEKHNTGILDPTIFL